MQQLIALYTRTFGREPVEVKPLTAAGSNRQYFRLSGAPTVVGVVGTSEEENAAFLAVARHFFSKLLHVPQLFAVSNDGQRYLQQDLGSTALFDLLAEARQTGVYTEEHQQLLSRTIRELPRIQYLGAEGFDFSVCYPLPEFDERSISFDLNYFKYCYLKLTGLEFNEVRLDDDFRRLTQKLLADKSNTFMYRDFQARNVMIADGQPYFIDFQGGRRGPVYYDVASFLWQAKAQYPTPLREALIDDYIAAVAEFQQFDSNAFRATLRHFVLFRLMQVLGAYGFRGLHEKKPHFIQSIPYALQSIRELLRTPFEEYPYLSELLLRLTEVRIEPEKQPLTVEILSFSFKNGYPYDASGNGGGYIFDCRALHNPGRYEEYKQLTGMDQPVVDFLRQYDEVEEFIRHAEAMMSSHVERYVERGFSHLQAAFGCTGGQHRSVYCAEQLAHRLHEKYPDVQILVHHREQKKKYKL